MCLNHFLWRCNVLFSWQFCSFLQHVQVFATFGDDVQLRTCSFNVCVDAIKYGRHIFIGGMHYA